MVVKTASVDIENLKRRGLSSKRLFWSFTFQLTLTLAWSWLCSWRGLWWWWRSWTWGGWTRWGRSVGLGGRGKGATVPSLPRTWFFHFKNCIRVDIGEPVYSSFLVDHHEGLFIGIVGVDVNYGSVGHLQRKLSISPWQFVSCTIYVAIMVIHALSTLNQFWIRINLFLLLIIGVKVIECLRPLWVPILLCKDDQLFWSNMRGRLLHDIFN